MDKNRDVRRGASRFSPVKRQINKQSGRKLFSGLDGGGSGGGDIVLKEKSKKERVRKLSVVGRASSSYEDCEMGCFGSDGDDDLKPQAVSPSCSNKRFKLPKRFFDDCNSVDHTPVPRKIRSAMKKRNRESLSPPFPDSEKLNHTMSGVESSEKKDGSTKKSKMDMKQGSSDIAPRRVVPAPITKDEEEAVETLYALAGMFSTIESTNKSKLDVEFPEVKPSALPEAGESSRMAFKVPKDIADSACPSATAEAANPSSSIERTPRERGTVIADLCKPCVPEQPILADCKQFHAESGSVSQENLQTMPFQSECEPADKKPLCSFVNFGVPAQPSLESGLKRHERQEALLPQKEPDIELGSASHFGSRREQQHSIKQPKKDGLALWPGLSSSHGAEIHGPPLRSSAAKYPAWLAIPTCTTRPGSSQNGISTEKVSTAAVERKSWKRCAAHVHISHLIQVLHISERRDRLPVQPNQLRPNEGLKQEVLMVVNNVKGVRKECSGLLSGGIIGGSAVEPNPNEARNGVLLHKRLHQDQQQAAVPSGTYALQKQSFDFLSLSAGSGGMEANNSNNRAKNGLESLSQLPIPYFHSLSQNQTIMPFSLPQTRYSTSTYPDQLSAAGAQQISLHLPLYPGNQFCGTPHTNPPSSRIQQHQQLQQQQQQRQQQIWAAQLAYRPGITSAAITQFPNWQNGRQDSTSLVPCSHAILPPSSAALEVQGPKYMPISPQQQQLRAITSSLAPARVRRHHHQIPSGYEENGGGFRSGSMLPSELLCNEHL